MYFKPTDPEDFELFNEAAKYTMEENTDKSIKLIEGIIERNPNYPYTGWI